MVISSDIFNNLSYPTQEKTKKLYDLKDKISNLKPWYYFFAFAFAICVIICLTIVNDFINSFPYSNISQSDTALITVTFVLFVLFYFSQIKLNELKTSYEKLRIDIIKSMGNEFCTHSHPCTCRDDYLRQMHEVGIDLIFK